MRKLILGCLLAAWLLPVSRAAADVKVTALVDRDRITMGEAVQLRVTVDGASGGEVDTSPIAEFQVLPRGTSTSMQFVNGRTSRQTTYNFTLIPRKEGTLTIPALKVQVDNRTLTTTPVQIQVAAASAQPDAPHNRDVWVTAEVSTPAPYIGQQIVYTLKLTHAVQVRNARLSPPAFESFDARELEQRSSYPRVINGREHLVNEVHYLLTPQKTGTLSIEPATLQVDLLAPAPRGRRSPMDDFFDDPFFNRGRVESRVLQSPAVTVNVQPLPPYTLSDRFSGLVGDFYLTAVVEKELLKVGDSTTLAVTIEGRGNIAAASAPPLRVPDAFKTYADTPEEQITVQSEGTSGRKIFRTALVPLRAGRFEIAPEPLTYFDPEAKAYRHFSSAPLSLRVAPSNSDQTVSVGTTAAAPPPAKRKVEFTGRDILPLKEDLGAIEPQRTIPPALFVIGLALPMLAFAGLTGWQRLRRKETGPAARMRARALRELKAAERRQDQEPLPRELYQALVAAIFCAAGREGQALTWKEAEAILLQSGRDPQIAREAAELLERIESVQFSGASVDAGQRSALIETTRRMVRKLIA